MIPDRDGERVFGGAVILQRGMTGGRKVAHQRLDARRFRGQFSFMRTTLILTLALSATACAQGPAPEFKPPKEVAPGIFEVGTVRLDKNTNTVTLPAKVNMIDGLVEYLCVTPRGATHESVLVSEAGPQNVHVAMVLLGAKGAAPAEASAKPGQITAEYLAKLPKLVGDRVHLSVKWKDKEGKEQTVPVERWVLQRILQKNKPAKEQAMKDGPWLYNGSFIFESRFVAESEGIFASIATMPSALINNPRPGANDDKMWFANKAALPPLGTPVDFIIKLEKAQETQK
jgi:hypothetical protein